MSYLLDKKIQRKKIFYSFLSVLALLILFYFRTGIFNGFSYLGHTVFRPVLVFRNVFAEKFQVISAYLSSKNSLFSENQILKSKLDEDNATVANYNSLLAENLSLKEILGRKHPKADLILSAILAKPNQSPYDTLIIDAGANQGLRAGARVFALGDVPIGHIANIYPNSSKAILFSNAGEKTEVVFGSKNIFLEIVGRGGGNFEMIVPRDLTLAKGDQVVLPGITPYVLGIVETIISDPRDPFIKALLVSPVNIQELKFVEVEIAK